MTTINVCIVIFIFSLMSYLNCYEQIGPDPWNYISSKRNQMDEDIPPDLRISNKKHDCNYGTGEWFFKRALAIILMGGQTKKNNDESVNVIVQMEFNQQQWATLQEYMSTGNSLSDEMYRRAIGYLEAAIYETPISEKIVLAWTEYFYRFIVDHKMYFTWAFSMLAAMMSIFYLWTYLKRHWIIILFTILYFYEVLISYKEAEQQELNIFLSAISKCKWYFWTSSCEAPQPDPLIFLKHMSPMKIAIRMFTSFLAEPMVVISSSVKIMLHGMTDGLWFPFDKIMYGLLLLIFNASLVFLLIMIIFNYILNTAFNINFLGLINIGIHRSKRRLFGSTNENQTQNTSNNQISSDTLNRILDVVSHALTNSHNNRSIRNHSLPPKKITTVRRSASAGRLPILMSEPSTEFDGKVDIKKFKTNGSGDAR